jgi:hypothetical protein
MRGITNLMRATTLYLALLGVTTVFCDTVVAQYWYPPYYGPYVTTPVRPFGNPTTHFYDPWRGSWDSYYDTGRLQRGLPPVTVQNPYTGDTKTFYKKR